MLIKVGLTCSAAWTLFVSLWDAHHNHGGLVNGTKFWLQRWTNCIQTA